MRLTLLVLAIILTGIGAAITVDVNIVPNPADGLARVIGEKCGKNMGFGKNLFDFSAIVISSSICSITQYFFYFDAIGFALFNKFL